MPVGYQLIIRMRDDRPIAPDTNRARRFVRSVARIIRGFDVPSLGLAADHGHIAVLGDRAAAGELARRIEIGLFQILEHRIPWEPARIRAIHDQAHARALFWYVVRQPMHHGVHHDPWFEASNIPELLGARVVLHQTVRSVRVGLPRVDLSRVQELASFPPASREVALDLGRLADAAASALALPLLRGKGALVRVGRVAAVQVARPFYKQVEIARALGVSVPTIRRCEQGTAPAALVEAVRRQWRWRCACRERAAS